MWRWISVVRTSRNGRFRFKALVSHAGVYNLTSMYGATEELWFPEWEFKGTPWTNKAMYERWSPHNYGNKYFGEVTLAFRRWDRPRARPGGRQRTVVGELSIGQCSEAALGRLMGGAGDARQAA